MFIFPCVSSCDDTTFAPSDAPTYQQMKVVKRLNDEELERRVLYSAPMVSSTMVTVEKGSVFYLVISISNPSEYEILSFTLNGVKYASYMFESGSTFEKLILAQKATSTPGIYNLTLDEMKYVDSRNKIRNISMSESTSITYCVKSNYEPVFSIKNEKIYASSYSFEIVIEDSDHILTDQTLIITFVSAVQELKKEVQLTDIHGPITFENIYPGTDYVLEIYSQFDKYDGHGLNYYGLFSKAVTTPSLVKVGSLKVFDDGIYSKFIVAGDTSFGISFTSLKLYDASGVLKATKDNVSEYFFTVEDKSNSYYIRSEYTYIINTGTITSYTDSAVVSFEKIRPYIDISLISKGYDFLTFNISSSSFFDYQINKLSLIDPTGKSVKEITNREENDTVNSNNEYTFSRLMSDTEYRLVVGYTVNIVGNVTAINKDSEKVAKTLAYDVPDVTMTNLQVSKSSISGTINIQTAGYLATIQEIGLYQNRVLLQSTTQADFAFYYLNSYTKYVIQVTYKYDLNNGDGEKTAVKTFTATTDYTIDDVTFKLGNSSKYIYHDKNIVLLISTTKPEEMTIYSARINGYTYDCSFYNDTYVAVNISASMFTTGEQTLTLDKITLEDGSYKVPYVLTDTLSVKVEIVG